MNTVFVSGNHFWRNPDGEIDEKNDEGRDNAEASVNDSHTEPVADPDRH